VQVCKAVHHEKGCGGAEQPAKKGWGRAAAAAAAPTTPLRDTFEVPYDILLVGVRERSASLLLLPVLLSFL
jgi:hypothetical protein